MAKMLHTIDILIENCICVMMFIYADVNNRNIFSYDHVIIKDKT